MTGGTTMTTNPMTLLHDINARTCMQIHALAQLGILHEVYQGHRIQVFGGRRQTAGRVEEILLAEYEPATGRLAWKEPRALSILKRAVRRHLLLAEIVNELVQPFVPSDSVSEEPSTSDETSTRIQGQTRVN